MKNQTKTTIPEIVIEPAGLVPLIIEANALCCCREISYSIIVMKLQLNKQEFKTNKQEHEQQKQQKQQEQNKKNSYSLSDWN